MLRYWLAAMSFEAKMSILTEHIQFLMQIFVFILTIDLTHYKLKYL